MKRRLVIEEACDLLRCSRRTLHGLAAAGKVPHVRMSGMRRLLFDEDELEAWLAGAELEVVDGVDGARVVRPVRPVVGATR